MHTHNLFYDIERPQIEDLLDSIGIKAAEIELDTPIRLNGRYVTIDQSSI